MRNKKIGIIILFMLLCASFCEPVLARPRGGIAPPPRNSKDPKQVLTAFNAYTQDANSYVTLYKEAMDTSKYMPLHKRRVLIEETIIASAKLNASITALFVYANDKDAMKLFDSIMQKALNNANYDMVSQPIILDMFPKGRTLNEQLRTIETYLNNEVPFLIDYASSLYKKEQLLQFGAHSTIREYETYLLEQYNYFKKNPKTRAADNIYGLLIAPPVGITPPIENKPTDNMPPETKPPNPGETLTDNPFYTEDNDTDWDGLSDKDEKRLGTNMYLQDTDRDGISDYQEILLGYDPCSRDTDNDGVGDMADHDPLDPLIGSSGINLHDDEEVLMFLYGSIAAGAIIGTLFGCSSCPGIAIKAMVEVLDLYQEELEEREHGTDEN